jgi:hypothetical protein
MRKKELFLVALLSVVSCSSCTGIYSPYLKEDRERFVKVDEGTPFKDFYIVMDADKKKRNGFSRFGYDISVTVYDRQYSTFILHSLTFENDKGDTIPYTLSYFPEHPIPDCMDSLNATFYNDTLMAVFGNEDKPFPRFYVYTYSEVPASRIWKIRVTYDMEINGKRIKGDCWFRKRIMIDSRPRFPRQPWYLN